jgi:hypothetical protein
MNNKNMADRNVENPIWLKELNAWLRDYRMSPFAYCDGAAFI